MVFAGGRWPTTVVDRLLLLGKVSMGQAFYGAIKVILKRGSNTSMFRAVCSVPHDVVGDDQFIKYDVYELPGEDRQFYVIHFYKQRKVDGYRKDFSLGQLTTDLSGTIAVSLMLWIDVN